MPSVTANGIDIAYEVHGEGFPLVLAHGFTATRAMWDAQIAPFSERYRVVAYDARGHGESGAPRAGDPRYTFDHLVDDQRALLEHLGIEQAYVGGLSMGGMIALRFALEHPEMVRALILCDTSAGGSSMSQVARQIQANRPFVELIVRTLGLRALASGLYSRLETAGVGRRSLPPAIDRQIEELDRMNVDGFLGAGRAIADQESVQERLGEISVPTLIITGDRDFMRGPSEELQRRLPNARFALITDAYHGSSMWQPEKFSAAVLDFLADVDAGRPVCGTEER